MTGVAAAGVLCILVAACTAPQPTATTFSIDESALIESTLIPGSFALPLDEVMAPDVERSRVVTAAIDFAMNECLAGEGAGPVVQEFVDASIPDRMGLAESVSDAGAGYRQVRPEANVYHISYDGVFDNPQSVVSDETLALMYGDGSHLVTVTGESGDVIGEYDPDSCLGRAIDDVTPRWIRLSELTPQLHELYFYTVEESASAAPVADAFARWSSCMSARGFEFANPTAALMSSWPGENPMPEEIATATADVDCKAETGLLWSWSAEMARLQEFALAEEPTIFAEWRDIVDDHYVRAQEIVDEAGITIEPGAPTHE